MSMFKEIITDYRSMNQDDPAMRKFGLLLGLILIALAGLILFRKGLPDVVWLSTPFILLVLGLLSLCMAFIIPKALKPINSVMIIISLCIGYCITRVVLFMVFFGLFLPIGLILRMLGKDFMRIKRREDEPSYWIACADEQDDQARTRRQF